MRSSLTPGVLVVPEGEVWVEDIGGPRGNINNNDVFVP